MWKYIFLVIACFVCQFSLKAQVTTNREALQRMAFRIKQESTDSHRKTDSLAKFHHWAITMRGKNGNFAKLVGTNEYNKPVYYSTFNNVDAAATVGTTPLWSGGSSGLNLNGSSPNMKNKLAIWDGGRVLDTHIELIGRINRMDSSTYNGGSDHATHVTGTMIARGINPLVKGMANGLQGILTYDFSLDGNDYNDIPEISGVASNIFLSNHSYGSICGWYEDEDGNWIWYGNYGDTVDYNFGYYSQETQELDNICYNAPYYLPVRAAGNSRNQNGPAYVGQTYYYYDSNGQEQQGTWPANISSNNAYNTLAPEASGKNIITVGAISAIPYGYTQPSDVIMSAFSSWGPTNDGRIKPDLVGDGVNVYSTVAEDDSAYDYDSGTSMASPNVAGSLLLLQEYYSELHNGDSMRAATLKGLAIHTANQATTTPGPTYEFGWGLLNTAKAAEAIKVSNATKNAANSQYLIYENTLNSGLPYSQTFTATGTGSLKATISWTDPAGSVVTVNAKNPPIPELVNDLDLRIIKNGTTTYKPWILNPANPAAAATTGDNYLDNVEQVVVDTVNKGDTYTIQITNKGTLTNGSQAYSLIISQPEDTALPLKLLSFTATLINDKVNLNWATTNEVSTNSFIVETSVDGTNWSDIATEAAKNNKSTNQYSLSDILPQDGTNYYRLKMVDADGSFTYSQVQSVQLISKIEIFSLAPNPAESQTTLLFDNDIKQASVTVFNILGRVVATKQVNLQGNKSCQIETALLPSGVYIIRVNSNNGTSTKKLLINHN